MTGGSRSNPTFEELRKKAERILSRQDQALAVEGKDLLHLAHELEVQQIELELQNRELQRARGEAEAVRYEYAELYDSAPVAYLTLDGEGRIEKANAAAYRMFRQVAMRLVGSRFATWVYWDDYPAFSAFMKKLISSAERGGHTELRILGKKYRPFYVRLEAQALFDRQKHLRWRFVLIDVTDRKEAEAALRRAHDDLEEKVRERTAEFEAMARQRDYLSRRMVDLLERDRCEVGNALHEEIGQVIAGVMLQLENVKKAGGDESRKERVNEIQETLRAGVKQVRKISQDLRSEVLDRHGLGSAIEELADNVKKESNIDVKLYMKNLPQAMDGKQRDLVVYRVVQESLTNVLKHAGAKEVSIHLARREGQLVVMVEDDGVGFDYEAVSSESRGERTLGLTIMRERVSQVGGEFHVDSAPGRGTQIMAEIPLDDAGV